MDAGRKDCFPPLDLASSPSLTQTNHIPNISGSTCYLHNALGIIFQGLVSAQGGLSNDDFILAT